MIKKRLRIITLLFFSFLLSRKTFAQFVEPETKIPETKENSFILVNSASEIVTFFFAFIFIMSIIGFLFAGLKFITAGGSDGSLESANKAWIASLVGLIVSLIGYIMIHIAKLNFF
ncbi:MAG: hypothetical protein PF549_05020 [Patescibacteria group bacterium]|jgi:hypothetical protein|nr:hypothetical protein [Patescibacteria group bacterium]